MTEVHGQVLCAHRERIAAVVDAGATVAAGLEEPVTDPTVVRGALGTRLRERGLLAGLLDLLDTGADALNEEIRGQPVAALPYLSVTSRGPVCRATLADGRRLVVVLALFAIQRRPRRYRFRDPTPSECLQVTIRGV